jgi:hypothetical protein
MKLKILLLFCLFAGAQTVAQTGRIRIWVEAKTSDAVGRSFVYQLREEIAHSALYALADSREKAFLDLSIISASLDEADNTGSAVSIVLFWLDGKNRMFMDQFLMVVGAHKTLECAQRLMAFVDSDEQAYTKAARTMLRQP